MYQYPLERLLIYTNKESRQEFNIADEAWYELYELFVTTKYDVLDDDITAIDFFNEVFYLLTYTYANEDAAERINEYLSAYSPLCPPPPPQITNPTNRAEREAADEYNERVDEINNYLLGFIWFILKKQKELPIPVALFLSALDKMIDGVQYDYDFYKDIHNYLDTHTAKYLFSFQINPQVVLDVLLRSTKEWKDATYDFDRNVVQRIIKSFHDKEDAETIIEEIRKKLAEDNKNKNNSNPKVSMITHRKKANDEFLNQLLKESELNTFSEQQNNIVHEGFEEFILRDHRKVLNLLMFIAHLGKGQMPLFIKCIKALQLLGYMDKNCLDNVDLFVKKAIPQFDSINFDVANVRRQVGMASTKGNNEYNSLVETIAEYMKVVITG